MPVFTPSARPQILAAIQREARYISDPHAREVFKRAAVETGLVESNLTNPSGGDADSAGWRQERRSLYPNPTNIDASARRFRQEFQKLYSPGEKSYDVAAQVQRPAAQYRGRYKDRAKDAARVLAGAGGSAQSPVARTQTETTTTTPGVDNSAARAAAIQQYLGTKGADSLDFAMQIRALRDVAGRKVTTTTPGSTPSGSSGVTPLGGGVGGPGGFRVTGADPGRIKPSVLQFARKVSAIYGKPLTGDSGATHSKMTVDGNVSDHWSGNATDIPASGAELIRLGRAALIAAGMPRAQALKAPGGLYNVGGHQVIFATNQGGNHFDHLHISAR